MGSRCDAWAIGSEFNVSRKDLGDFATPPALVDIILASLGPIGELWPRVFEPACGRGNFIAGLLRHSSPPRQIIAFELQPDYHAAATALAKDAPSTGFWVENADIFAANLARDLHWRCDGPLLVIGNPPWITNAALSKLGSANVPPKTNLRGLRGIDAVTGTSNFDVTEFIWLKLLSELRHERPAIALLCKTAVARNVLEFAARKSLPVRRAALRRIDAARWFGAAVDACLFYLEVGEPAEYAADVFANLETVQPTTTMAVANGRLIADAGAYAASQQFDGSCPFQWRQGVKHDLAAVMELRRANGSLINGFGQTVDVEAEYLFPLMKCTDVHHGRVAATNRSVIITQRRLGEDTSVLKGRAPRLWAYLQAHRAFFARRKSVVYRHAPPYAMFGIGGYSFAPYKVAISGLHKQPRFRVVGPIEGKPVLFDDACYFLSFEQAAEARSAAAALNSPLCDKLLNAIVFREAKRPITKKILSRIDVSALVDAQGPTEACHAD